MAFSAFDPDEIDSGDPVKQELWQKVLDNFDDHEIRISDLENTSAVSVLVGEIRAYGGGVAPSGWLICDGTVLLQTSFPDLFAVIGTEYNQGGEAGSEFRIPESRGRNILGEGNSPTGGITTRLRGELDGAEAHSHPMPHTHTTNHNHKWYTNNTAPPPQFSSFNAAGAVADIVQNGFVSNPGDIGTANSVNTFSGVLGAFGEAWTDNDATTSSQPSTANTSNAPNVDPFFVALFIIKT